MSQETVDTDAMERHLGRLAEEIMPGNDPTAAFVVAVDPNAGGPDEHAASRVSWTRDDPDGDGRPTEEEYRMLYGAALPNDPLARLTLLGSGL